MFQGNWQKNHNFLNYIFKTKVLKIPIWLTTKHVTDNRQKIKQVNHDKLKIKSLDFVDSLNFQNLLLQNIFFVFVVIDEFTELLVFIIQINVS